MKVISVNNQSQKRSITFGDLKSLVAGDGSKLGKRTAALAFRLEGRDSKRYGNLSKTLFPRTGFDSDVLQIGIKDFDGTPGSQHVIFVNHQAVLGPDRRSETFMQSLKPIKLLLSRVVAGTQELDRPISTERRKMLGFLQGEGIFTFAPGELADEPSKIQSVAKLLLTILEKIDAPK